MTRDLTLTSPGIELQLESVKHWRAIMVTWIVATVVLLVGLVYAYVFILPSYIGFEAAVLLGIALIVLSASGGGS